MRCFKVEGFSRAMIDFIYYGLNLVIDYILKIATFCKGRSTVL